MWKSSALSQQMICKECGGFNSCLVMEDKHTKRKECASHLRVRCIECSWVYTFYKSKQIHHGFDVNRKLVYTMRSIGQGHASLKRFFAHINMPAPLGYTAYRDNNIALAKAAKSVATKSMFDSAAVLHKNSSEVITQCAVAATWSCHLKWLCHNVVDRQWEVLACGNFVQGVSWVPENRKGRGYCQEG